MVEVVRREPPALPANTQAWMDSRKLKSAPTLNDQVEEIHMVLTDEPEYTAFLYAVYDEQAVEGSLAADNIKAAEMIRSRAKRMDANHPLVREKLATIAKALGVVLRRYGNSRKERRNMVHGEVVPNDNND